jgi:type I site-specific restriction endonuclease
MTADDLGDYIAAEDRARVRIDEMLARAGWVVQDYKAVNLFAGEGVAVRELVTNAGPADYVLFVNRQAVGMIEAKRQGTTLAGAEWQTVKYQSNSPDELPAHRAADGRLPFGYETTGDEGPGATRRAIVDAASRPPTRQVLARRSKRRLPSSGHFARHNGTAIEAASAPKTCGDQHG